MIIDTCWSREKRWNWPKVEHLDLKTIHFPNFGETILNVKQIFLKNFWG